MYAGTKHSLLASLVSLALALCACTSKRPPTTQSREPLPGAAAFAGAGVAQGPSTGADPVSVPAVPDGAAQLASDPASAGSGGTAGAGATPNAGASALPPPLIVTDPSDEAAYVYDQNALRTYELKLAPADLALIDSDPRAELYVPGTLVFEGREYGPVGIRYKGSVGAFRDCIANGFLLPNGQPSPPAGSKICTKLSIKVSFNWQLPEVAFYGLRKLQFHSMNRDPSMLKERLGYAVFRAFGVPAPRAVHARLLVNGTFVGLFALVEQIDGRFTRSRFSEGGEGNLYDQAWPLDSMRLPVTESYLLSHLETNEDQSPSFAPMLGFAAALAAADLTSLPDVIARYTDVEAAMRYVAVDRTIAHDDGPFHWYCSGAACGNHNYYWYQAANEERLWIIAWDLDSSFNLDNTTTTLTPAWDDSSLPCTPALYPPAQLPLLPPACDRLTLGWATMQTEYLAAVDALLRGPLSEPSVEELLQRWEAQIAPIVAEAEAAYVDAVTTVAWQGAREALRSAIGTLRARAAARVAKGPVAVSEPPPAAPL